MANTQPQHAESDSPKVQSRREKRKSSARRVTSNLSVEQQAELITSHFEIAKRLAWSFLNRWHARLEDDEVLSITGTALCEAAARFNSRLGVGFQTFLFYYLRGLLLKEISRRIKDRSAAQDLAEDKSVRYEAALAYGSVENVTPESLLARREAAVFCSEAYAKLDALEKQVLTMFFIEDKTVVAIAKELGYCRCHISRVKTKALETVRQVLDHHFTQEMCSLKHLPGSNHRKKQLRQPDGDRKKLKDAVGF
jgi:RNA polymerase sigma factor (sigma-70 family)